ncbi:MAG: hypothetical protein IPG32_14005 [Saprospirales bacterium]|nr:hypothetical protein [Saprospirales bacterium]
MRRSSWGKKTEGNAVNPLIRPAGREALVNEPFDKLYSRRFLNYEAQSDRYSLVPELGNLLIISHGAYIPILEPLVEWKQQKGIPTRRWWMWPRSAIAPLLSTIT